MPEVKKSKHVLADIDGFMGLGGDPAAQAAAIRKASRPKAKIVWDKRDECFASSGFTEKQESVLAELMPYGFSEKLKAVGLDPKTFKIQVSKLEE